MTVIGEEEEMGWEEVEADVDVEGRGAGMESDTNGSSPDVKLG